MSSEFWSTERRGTWGVSDGQSYEGERKKCMLTDCRGIIHKVDKAKVVKPTLIIPKNVIREGAYARVVQHHFRFLRQLWINPNISTEVWGDHCCEALTWSNCSRNLNISLQELGKSSMYSQLFSHHISLAYRYEEKNYFTVVIWHATWDLHTVWKWVGNIIKVGHINGKHETNWINSRNRIKIINYLSDDFSLSSCSSCYKRLLRNSPRQPSGVTEGQSKAGHL